MRHRVGLAVFVATLLAAPMVASAASPWASEATYTAKVCGKLRYGLINTLLGWTSLFRTPVKAGQAGENVVVGVGRGIWNAVGQTAGGALHTATFLLPQVDVPLPEGGTDLLQ